MGIGIEELQTQLKSIITQINSRNKIQDDRLNSVVNFMNNINKELELIKTENVKLNKELELIKKDNLFMTEM